MKRLIVGGLIFAQAVFGDSLSLQDAYQRAFANSEALKISEEQTKYAEARYNEAVSAIFPQISLQATEQIRNSTSGASGEGSGIPSGSRSRFRTALSFTQPIFSGFREFLLADAAKFELRTTELQTERRREELLLDVFIAYEKLRASSLDLQVLLQAKETLDARIKELTDWIKLGKSKASEVSAAEADRADLSAVVEEARGAKLAAAELLRFYVGGEVAEIRLTVPKVQSELLGLEKYLANGANRKDILANLEQVKSAGKQLRATERERWPTVDLSGNYYPYQDPDSQQDWDLLVGLKMPLFDSGRISARVAQGRSLMRQKELSLTELRKVVDRDIRVAYQQLQSSLKSEASLRLLVSEAEKSFKSQRADYALGIVTNIDVLQAIRKVEDAKRRLLASEVESRINLQKLRILSGEVPAL